MSPPNAKTLDQIRRDAQERLRLAWREPSEATPAQAQDTEADAPQGPPASVRLDAQRVARAVRSDARAGIPQVADLRDRYLAAAAVAWKNGGDLPERPSAPLKARS
jgi:hypothetical protein